MPSTCVPPLSSCPDLDQILGICIICAVVLQAGLGGYHHYRYQKDRPLQRRWFTHLHLWLGRILIVTGLVNCGFGLILAGVGWTQAIIWWSITGAGVLMYIVAYMIMSTIHRATKKALPPAAYVRPGDNYELGNVHIPPSYSRAGPVEPRGYREPYSDREILVQYDPPTEKRPIVEPLGTPGRMGNSGIMRF
jgi:hypothetical protein